MELVFDLFLISFPGEQVGSFICFPLELCCLAYAIELLYQDRQCNSSKVSEKTARQRNSSSIDKEVKIKLGLTIIMNKFLDTH